MNADFLERFMKYFEGLFVQATLDTVLMLTATMFIAIVVGLMLGVVLVLTREDGLRPQKTIYRVLDFLVNFVRSFPIMILIVALLPVTRMVIGTAMGVRGAIFPLSVAASAFMARIYDNAMIEVDPQLIEAAKSFGASDSQIVAFVIMKEAVPAIVSGITLTSVSYLSATTIAGAIGAGGLGSVAINYGYHRFDDMILYTGVIILCVLVQVIQFIGKRIYNKVKI